MEEKEFIIRDRRAASSEDGEETAKETSPRSDAGAESDAPGKEETKAAAPLPELDFSSFLLSLATSAQVSLGNMPNPQTNLQAQNLPAAKQMIDIIGLLKEKTKGNLDQEELLLVDSILYNLRMQYVRAVEGKK
ncbi:MAG TPA: DUF1844 domain-containing protein [Nitrospirota bacterium]